MTNPFTAARDFVADWMGVYQDLAEYLGAAALPVLAAYALPVAVLVAFAYWLGAIGAGPRLADAALDLIERGERIALDRGPSAPLIWWPYQTLLLLLIIGEFFCAPRATVARLRNYRLLNPKTVPQEVTDAVTEAMRLHLPGKTFRHLSIYMFEGSEPSLSNVAAVTTEGEVIRFSIGRPTNELEIMNGKAPRPDQTELDRLKASCGRVSAAVASMGPLPVGSLGIPLT